jgi:hypothetical protein
MICAGLALSGTGVLTMKLRLVVVFVAVVALGASGAVAAPPPGKGKPEHPGKSTTTGESEAKGKPSTTGPLCRPRVTVVLKGTFSSSSTTALSMTVTHTNRWGRAYLGAGPVTVAVDDMTKVRRNGQKLLSDLVPGDRLLVQARACKADLAADVPPALSVVRVVAHPSKTKA